MQLINSHDLMLPGDVFDISADELSEIFFKPTAPRPAPRAKPTTKCKVSSLYLCSFYEIRYVCYPIESPKREFVLGQFLVDAYQVSLSAKELIPSMLIINHAKTHLGIRSFSEFLPNCFTKEDADRIATYIEGMNLTERNGYLLPVKLN